MRKSTILPPLAFQDYPIDVQIRIYRDGSKYQMEIQASGSFLEVPIDMSPHDLVLLNKQLKDTIEATAMEDVAGQEKMLESLAEAGYYAYKRVFGFRTASSVIQELIRYYPQASFQITTEDFFLPWELIYPYSLKRPLAFTNFLGARHVISRVIAQDLGNGAFVSPRICYSMLPRLGLIVDKELEHVVNREIPYFRALYLQKKIFLLRLGDLDPGRKREELETFASFLIIAGDIAHFACHATYDQESPDLSYIKLSDEFPISLQDLEILEFSLGSNPLVFLNACETGNLNPLYAAFFAKAFLKHGARGVVATDCAVPDAFAADFAEQVYNRFFTGMTLGESLLQARQYFIEKCNNPTGLLYSMYAPPSIRLEKARENEQQ